MEQEFLEQAPSSKQLHGPQQLAGDRCWEPHVVTLITPHGHPWKHTTPGTKVTGWNSTLPAIVSFCRDRHPSIVHYPLTWVASDPLVLDSLCNAKDEPLHSCHTTPRHGLNQRVTRAFVDSDHKLLPSQSPDASQSINNSETTPMVVAPLSPPETWKPMLVREAG